MVHVCRAFIEAHSGDPDFMFVSIDIVNAFNIKNRGTMIKAVGKFVPCIFKLSVLLYHDYATLNQVDGDTLESQTGQQQGCNFGNLAWACYDKYIMELLPALRKLTNMLNVAFVDDG